MGKKFVHPRTGEVYLAMEDGTVTVTDPATGESGLFSRGGEWISGELRSTDAVMCEFVGGTTARPKPKV
jgi:hypothetical protein